MWQTKQARGHKALLKTARGVVNWNLERPEEAQRRYTDPANSTALGRGDSNKGNLQWWSVPSVLRALPSEASKAFQASQKLLVHPELV